MASQTEFSNKRLIIIENGYFLDDETRVRLRRIGVDVVCTTGGDGLEGLRNGLLVDGAVVDISLSAELSFELSEALESLGIPHVFALTKPADEKPPFGPYRLCDDLEEILVILNALFGQGQLN